MTLPDVSVIVVSWNTKELLRACLRSVFERTRGVSFEVWVVDNASTDGSAEMVAAAFPSVKLIRNGTNRGFGAGCNQAIAASAARYVLILNSDTELIEDTPRTLATFMDARGDVGALGCTLVSPDGSLQPSCYRKLSPWQGFAFASGFYLLIPYGLLSRLRPRGVLRRVLDFPDHDCEMEPDWFSGACMMLRREALEETGPFDEAFHLFCEETDLFHRMRKRGWRVVYTPRTRVVHHGEQSWHTAMRSASLEYYRSVSRFYRKHFGGRGLFALRVLALAGAAIRTVFLFAWLALRARPPRETFRSCGVVMRWALS